MCLSQPITHSPARAHTSLLYLITRTCHYCKSPQWDRQGLGSGDGGCTGENHKVNTGQWHPGSCRQACHPAVASTLGNAEVRNCQAGVPGHHGVPSWDLCSSRVFSMPTFPAPLAGKRPFAPQLAQLWHGGLQVWGTIVALSQHPMQNHPEPPTCWVTPPRPLPDYKCQGRWEGWSRFPGGSCPPGRLRGTQLPLPFPWCVPGP